MNKLNVTSLTLSLAALCALPSVSQAQDAEARGDGVRLHLGTGIGVGGEIETDSEDDDEPAETEDLVVTPNLHLGIEVPLHDYFTLGGEVGLAFWNTESRADPDPGFEEGNSQLQLDILARPKVRFTVLPGLELYGVVPVGFTYYVPVDMESETPFGEVSVDGGPGFAVGGAAGATYFFTQRFGITGELGYLYRSFKSTANLGGTSVDLKHSFGQLQMNAGVTFAF